MVKTPVPVKVEMGAVTEKGRALYEREVPPSAGDAGPGHGHYAMIQELDQVTEHASRGTFPCTCTQRRPRLVDGRG